MAHAPLKRPSQALTPMRDERYNNQITHGQINYHARPNQLSRTAKSGAHAHDGHALAEAGFVAGLRERDAAQGIGAGLRAFVGYFSWLTAYGPYGAWLMA